LRRDILELDASVQRTIHDTELGLGDVEAIRLLLSGGSVVDWQRLAFRSMADVDRFLSCHLLDHENQSDRERLRYVFNEAVSFLEEHLRLRFPRDLRNPTDVRQVFLWASQTGGFRRKQILSCAVLKLMHVTHHMEAADLKYKTSMSEEHLFDLAEASILKRSRQLREEGLAIVSFYGSRKSRSSIISKLVAKKDNVAATIFDKLRFRIVVETHDDLVPTMAWLCNNFFPYNYCIPDQSHNNLLDPEMLARYLPRADRDQTQVLADAPVVETSGKNEFSGATYRMINFIIDYPVRLPHTAEGRFGFELGRVVFLKVEFQVLDEETARRNEQGDNAHHLYKQRQRDVVARRLKRGGLRRGNQSGASTAGESGEE
jgi:uncharacterized protein (TIGR04552 family)